MKYPTLNRIREIFERAKLRAKQSKLDDKEANPCQYISAKDQKRAEKFASVELSKQDLEYIEEDKKQSKEAVIEAEKARYQIIEALHEGLVGVFQDQAFKKASIDSFARSRMSIEDIKTHLEQVREFQNMNKTVHQGRTTSKLIQKSLPDESYIY